MRYVVDASVAVKWYVPEIHSVAAERLLDSVHDLHAPDLIVPEFGNILWKKIARGELTVREGRKIVDAFLAVPVFKHSTSPLLAPTLDGATQSAQTVYDWTYLAMAIALDCAMVTADEKFFLALGNGRLGRHLCWVADLP
ncbi:MAG: type II toxin-antitoxin system VapC family toxin [Blastocatellia bacterium]